MPLQICIIDQLIVIQDKNRLLEWDHYLESDEHKINVDVDVTTMRNKQKLWHLQEINSKTLRGALCPNFR